MLRNFSALMHLLLLPLILSACAFGQQPPQPAKQRLGLVRTYAEKPVSFGAKLHMQEVYENNIEQKSRSTFIKAAQNTGYVINDDTGLSVTLQIESSAIISGESNKSILQFRDVNPNARRPLAAGRILTNEINDRPIPALLLQTPVQGVPNRPGTLRMRIFIRNEEGTLWTGIAHAPLDGRSRTGLARAMAAKLASHIGQSVNEPEFRFTPLFAE